MQEFLERMKTIQDNILIFLENKNSNEEDFNKLKSFLKNTNIQTDRYELKIFLYLILHISNHHHRTSNFINKIRQILCLFKEEILKSYTNREIFSIFKSNKFIIYLLFQENMMLIDPYIVSILTSEAYKKNSYTYYFYNELKSSLNPDFCSKIESIIKMELGTDSQETIETFCNKNRQIGENDFRICKLIRKDSIDKFKEYVKENSISLSKKVKLSIFETNCFLINKRPTLIEYSAFFGSVQIFKYLLSSQVGLTPSLWTYAIHSQNLEIIHILEENSIGPPNNDYKECLLESIKCHHQDITNYFLEKYLGNQNDLNDIIHSQSIKFFNFDSYPIETDELLPFFNNFCKSDCYLIVSFLLENTNINVNERKIKNSLFFISFSNIKKIYEISIFILKCNSKTFYVFNIVLINICSNDVYNYIYFNEIR